MKKITSLDALKAEATYNDNKGFTNFFILLSHGLRSSKGVTYYPETNTFDVHNEIDGSYEDDLTEEQLLNETNIGAAIESGCFFRYDF